MGLPHHISIISKFIDWCTCKKRTRRKHDVKMKAEISVMCPKPKAPGMCRNLQKPEAGYRTNSPSEPLNSKV